MVSICYNEDFPWWVVSATLIFVFKSKYLEYTQGLCCFVVVVGSLPWSMSSAALSSRIANISTNMTKWLYFLWILFLITSHITTMPYVHIYPQCPLNSTSILPQHVNLPMPHRFLSSLFSFWENNKPSEFFPYVHGYGTLYLNVGNLLVDTFATSSIKNDCHTSIIHSKYFFSMKWGLEIIYIHYDRIFAGFIWYIFFTVNCNYCKFIKTMVFLEDSISEHHSPFCCISLVSSSVFPDPWWLKE